MRKLPQAWWFFLPVWLWFPAGIGVVALIARVGLWVGFFAAGIFMVLGMLAIVPIRRNKMSSVEALFWVSAGTLVIGLPSLILIYAIFGTR